MMELTSHQSDVGAVLEFGNQLISEGLVNEKEENEIREQMLSLNDRWEALRMAAMDRQTKYVTKWRRFRNLVLGYQILENSCGFTNTMNMSIRKLSFSLQLIFYTKNCFP